MTAVAALPEGQTLEVDHQVTVAEASRYRPGSGLPVRTVCGRLVWPVASSASLPPCAECGVCARHYRAWEDGRLRVAPDGAPSPAAPPEDDRHLCEDCGQTFKTAAGLGSHRRSHVRTPEPRTCGNCGETAAKNQPLRQGRCKRCDAYWRQHGEERPTPDPDGTFPCPGCGESFDTAAGVGVHRGRFCIARTVDDGQGQADDDPRPEVVLPPTTQEREQLARQFANTHCVDCDAEPLGGGMRCHSCFTKQRTGARGRRAS